MGHLLRKYPMPDPQRITYTFPVLASDNYIASAPSILRFHWMRVVRGLTRLIAVFNDGLDEMKNKRLKQKIF